MKKAIPLFRYLLSIHISALFLFFILRLFFYWCNLDKINSTEISTQLFTKAIAKGLVFDNVIACYILVLPLIFLPILSIQAKWIKPAVKVTNIYFITLYTLLFGFTIANIPYFNYSFTHLSASVLQWFKFGNDTAGMIFQEQEFLLYFILFFVVAFLFFIWNKYLYKRINRIEFAQEKMKFRLFVPVLLILWSACFIGIRGGLERYPIRPGAAYISNNAFYNQLGINPMFFFIKSCSYQKKNKNHLEGVLPTEEAIQNTRQLLEINTNTSEGSPIRRSIQAEKESLKKNVILILMESMASDFLDYTWQGKKLMPYLNQLTEESYYFENIYSAGIHTNNGIVASLYGYPAFFERPMMPTEIIYHTGLPVNLREQGYEILFFLTGNPNYDNMNQFLLGNGFNRIYSQYDYPKEKIANNFGVPDQYLFEYGLDILDKTSRTGEPFLATFLTVSNHPPLIVPEEFKETGRSDNESILSYVDSTIEYFIENAKKKDWFENTLFILVGDHGKITGEQPYEMSLTYNHVPLLFYSSEIKKNPRKFDQTGLQIDIYPSIMEMLNISYINNSLGESLFSHERPFGYFVSDTHVGCLDKELFYTYNPHTKDERLYHYQKNGREDLLETYPEKAKEMKKYAVSMLITSDYIIQEGLSGSKECR